MTACFAPPQVSQCDRRLGCIYPGGCYCRPRLGLGARYEPGYHYNPRIRQCVPGGEQHNCNGFRTARECTQRCVLIRWWPSPRVLSTGDINYV
uniref:Pancreatic trypsin inhibitor n=1 Tax=Rhipicephalus appendiculatus TaxID=34631 RepID=A0A131YJE2_RHIAP